MTWHTDIDARIDDLRSSMDYHCATRAEEELWSALKEIKRLRENQRPAFEVGDYLGQINDSHGNGLELNTFCGGHFGRDDYDLKRVVRAEPDLLMVVRPSGKHSQVTVGPTWEYPTFATWEDALLYRIPAARYAELMKG